MKDIKKRILLSRFREGEILRTHDEIVTEVKFRIAVNYKEIASLICSPDSLEELAAGYLVTSGIVTEDNPVESMRYDDGKGIMFIELRDNSVIKDMIFSRLKPVGCGDGILLFNENAVIKNMLHSKFPGGRISSLMSEFNKSSLLFQQTGGVHSAALTDGKEIIFIKEDIGRHNAIDKIIGHIILNKIDTADKALLTSGRISSEIIRKVRNAGISTVISRSAPTDTAVDLADNEGITLVGFARSTGFNVYSNPSRIT